MRAEYKQTNMMDFVLKQLKEITETLTVKLSYIANKYETVESKRLGDMYCAAKLKIDDFGTYMTYSEYALEKAGFPQSEWEDLQNNRSLIPIDKRNIVLQYEREYIIMNYVEKNEYYREISGLPPLNDTFDDFVYLEYEVDGVDIKKPVHMMDNHELMLLAITKNLTRLIEKYPEKRYLRHVYDGKVPIETARRTADYELMYIKRYLQDPGMPSVFVRLYKESRNYVLKRIYDKAYQMNSEYYDAFIGLFILTITCQRFMTQYFNQGINRDFYDKDIIKELFESYGLPYYNEISLTYMRKVAKNLNKLLRFKATDKVFVDIFKLFEIHNIDVTSYFLIKDRKKDQYYNPIFKYKEKKHEDGSIEMVEDVEECYELKFAQVPNDTVNLGQEIINAANHLDYWLVVDHDFLWGDDGDKARFMQEVMSQEFNYIETKYINLTSNYDLMKISFELCYFFRLLIDTVPNQSLLPELSMKYVERATLFDVIVALFAMICKKLGLAGNIIDTTTKNMSIYGFNFDPRMMKRIEMFINEYNEKVDIPDKIIDHTKIDIKQPPAKYKDAADVVNTYFDNKDVHEEIISRRYDAKTIEEYNLYKRIYDSSMLTKYTTDMYRDSKGNLPKTYLEYLRKHNVDLYTVVNETDTENMIDTFDSILYALELYFGSDKFESLFLDIPTLSVDSLRKFVFYLVDIFKSYTVDLTSMNVAYHIDDKRLQNIKVVLEEVFYVKWEDGEDVFNNYQDVVTSIVQEQGIDQFIEMIHDVFGQASFTRQDLLDKLKDWYAIYVQKEIGSSMNLDYYADIADMESSLEQSTKIKVKDRAFFIREETV